MSEVGDVTKLVDYDLKRYSIAENSKRVQTSNTSLALGALAATNACTCKMLLLRNNFQFL